jgi:hypothetical protein
MACVSFLHAERLQKVEGGTMQLGRSLLGAVIGGAIGVGLVVALYYFLVLDNAGLAVLVAICAGLGVRASVVTKGHASYLRGALTCLLALGAFAASKFLIATLASHGMLSDVRQVKRVIAAPDEAGSASEEASSAPNVVEAPHIEQRPSGTVVASGKSRLPQPFSTWDFIWLSAAALIAYELGRGTEVPHRIAPDDAPPATT